MKAINEVSIPSASRFRFRSLLLVGLALYLLFITTPNFQRGAEAPRYFAFTQSVVENYDLNIADNFRHDLVSPTYNWPDFHNHGGVVIWAYFFLYGKLLYGILSHLLIGQMPALTPLTLPYVFMGASTCVAGILTLALTFFCIRRRYGDHLTIAASFAIFWGTPFFLYMLYLNGQANVLASLFSAVFVVYFVQIARNERQRDWVCLGIIFGVSAVVKLDNWFHLVTVFAYIAIEIGERLIRKLPTRPTAWKVASFMCGAGLVWVPKAINDYIMFGTVFFPEAGLTNGRYSILWDMLFSSYRGLFFCSPILIFSFVGACCLFYSYVWRAERDSLNDALPVVLFCYFIAWLSKIYIVSHGYAWGGGSFGGRQYLSEFVLFTALFCEVFRTYRGSARRFIWGLAIGAVLWNAALAFVFLFGSNRVMSASEQLQLVFSGPVLRGVIQSFFPTHVLLARAIALLFIGPWIVIGLRYISKVKGKSSTVIARFGVATLATYVLITSMNVSFNPRQVAKMREAGFFHRSRIITPAETVDEENLASIDEMIVVYSKFEDFNMVHRLVETKNDYLTRRGQSPPNQ